MQRTVLARYLLIFFAISWQAPASADADFSPAQLSQGDRSIEALLPVPHGLPTGLYVVPCEASVTAAGRPATFECYSDQKLPGNLVDIVASTGRQAAFIPARRAGHPIDAHMFVTVRIYVTAAEPLVLAVPNNGLEADKYGLLYSAPQRITRIQWELPDKRRTLAYVRGKGGMLLWPVIHVSEQGQVIDFELRNASHEQADVVHYFETQIRTLEFVPGFAESKPVAMLYVQPLYDRD